MPNNRNACVAILLTCSMWSITAHASARPLRFLPGYLITNAGDTVSCDIDFKDWIQNPNSISARVKGETKTFSPADIGGFGVPGYASFKSATVTYHTQPTSGTDFPNQFSDNVETRSLFLKTIVNGPYSLYELRIPGRYVFFMKQQNSTITELVYRVKLVDQVIQEDQQFRNLLLDCFRQEGIAEENLVLINRTSYNASDLRKLAEKLNEHRIGKISSTPKKGASLQLDIFAGAVLQDFSSEFKTQYSTGQFASALSPIGGLNILCRFPFHFGSFAVGASIGYSEFKLSTDKSGTNNYYASANYNFSTTYTEHLWTKQSHILANLYAMYIFNPLRKTRPYLKAGLFQHYTLSGDNNIYDAYNSKTTGIRNGVTPISDSAQGTTSVLSLKSFYLNVGVAAGIMAGKHRLEIFTAIPAGDIGPESNTPFRIGTYGFCYYYTLLK